MKTSPLVTVLTIAPLALALTACSDPTSSSSTGGVTASASASTTPSTYDISQIPTVDEIAALVPDEIKARGTLRNGASTGYAPAEYMASDGHTPIGYDIDITRALAQVMGLEGSTQHAEFPTIIPALGTRFDIGASSFTITSAREEQVSMISYLSVGSAWGVAQNNPQNFDPANPCGTTIGVQTGTAQETYAATLSSQCEANGQQAITIMPHDLQTDIATRLIGGQYDATLADSTVIGYTVEQSNGQIMQIGDTFNAEPQGISINKNDAQLTNATQQAMQYLMDNGYLTSILSVYGAQDSALAIAEVNPNVE